MSTEMKPAEHAENTDEKADQNHWLFQKIVGPTAVLMVLHDVQSLTIEVSGGKVRFVAEPLKINSASSASSVGQTKAD